MSTKRVLLLSFSGIVVLGASIFFYLQWQIGLRCEEYVRSGSEALESGNYSVALASLGRRVSQSTCESPDATMLYQYAYARARIKEKNKKHIVDSISALRKAVSLDPKMFRAWDELALAWIGMGRHDRAVTVARKLVELDPSDHVAQRLLVTSLLGVHRNEEVIDLVEQKLNETPSRWWMHIAAASANKNLRKDELVDDAKISYLNRHERTLIETYVAILREETALAKTMIAGVLDTDTNDELFLETAVNLMVGLEVPEMAIEILEQRQATLQGGLRKSFVELSFYLERYERVVAYLEAHPAQLATEPSLLLLGIQAGIRVGKSEDDLSKLLEKAGPVATVTDKTWMNLINEILEPSSIKARAVAAEQVLEYAPSNAAVLNTLAEAWLLLGEPRRARKLAKLAMIKSKVWSAPAVTRANALMRTGQYDRALSASMEAVRRAPSSMEAALHMARSWHTALLNRQATDSGPIDELVEMLQRSTDVDLANYLATGEITRPDNSPPGLTGERKQPDGGVPADHDAGDLPTGRVNGSVVADARGLRSQARDLARSKFRAIRQCHIGSMVEQKTCWVQLLDEHANHLDTYLAGLEWASSAGANDLHDEIIRQLIRITPESSSLWRLARARQILSINPSEKSAAEAVLLIRHVLEQTPDQADAHLLMSIAMVQLRDTSAAYSHMLKAVAADPGRAVEILRTTLHIVKNEVPLSPSTLISWWKAITIQEIAGVHRKSVAGDAWESELTRFELAQYRSAMNKRLKILAAFAESLGKDSIAELAYRNILDLDTRDAVAMNNLAMVLVRNGRLAEEAMELAEAALGNEPENADYQDTVRQASSLLASQRAKTFDKPGLANATQGI